MRVATKTLPRQEKQKNKKEKKVGTGWDLLKKPGVLSLGSPKELRLGRARKDRFTEGEKNTELEKAGVQKASLFGERMWNVSMTNFPNLEDRKNLMMCGQRKKQRCQKRER